MWYFQVECTTLSEKKSWSCEEFPSLLTSTSNEVHCKNHQQSNGMSLPWHPSHTGLLEFDVSSPCIILCMLYAHQNFCASMSGKVLYWCKAEKWKLFNHFLISHGLQHLCKSNNILHFLQSWAMDDALSTLILENCAMRVHLLCHNDNLYSHLKMRMMIYTPCGSHLARNHLCGMPGPHAHE